MRHLIAVLLADLGSIPRSYLTWQPRLSATPVPGGSWHILYIRNTKVIFSNTHISKKGTWELNGHQATSRKKKKLQEETEIWQETGMGKRHEKEGLEVKCLRGQFTLGWPWLVPKPTPICKWTIFRLPHISSSSQGTRNTIFTMGRAWKMWLRTVSDNFGSYCGILWLKASSSYKE